MIVLCPQILEIDKNAAERLVSARRDIRDRRGDLVLAGVEDRNLPAFAEAGIVMEQLPVYKTVDAALAQFGLKVDRSGYRYEVVRAD